MSEREEFDKWCHESLILPMNFDMVDSMWVTWQAARASRWRSFRELNKRDGTEAVLAIDIGYMWIDHGEDLHMDAWHPLPDPPTKEELENLK